MTTHTIEPNEGTVHYDFDRSRAPIVTIASGDTVILSTLDASGHIEGPRDDGTPAAKLRENPPGHALCGPIAIEGARAGQTLKIDIVDVRPGTWGWTVGAGWSTPLNDQLALSDAPGCMLMWEMDVDAGTAVDQFGHRVQLSPFMGVIGMPPAEDGAHNTAPPRACGGNLDCKELVAGTTLYLPVSNDGVLLSIGDGHALQGDGEVSCTAIECPMDRVEVVLTVVDSPAVVMPRAWTPDAWITFGLDEDLREATRTAIDQMLDFMVEDGVAKSRSEAITLASLLVDMRITQLVNGTVGVHAMLRHDARGA